MGYCLFAIGLYFKPIVLKRKSPSLKFDEVAKEGP